MNRQMFVHTLLAGGSAVALREMHRAQAAPPKLKKAAAMRTLADHTIARIEARQVQDRFPRSVGRNSRGNPAGAGGGYRVRTITTDNGVSGWGMSWVQDDRVQKYIGVKLTDVFDIGQGAEEQAIRDALDLPLHELASNILGVPVYVILGAAGPTEVPIYSGAIYFDDLEPPNNPRGVAGVLASCQQDYDAGFRAFKLKIGRGFKWIPGEPGIQRDIEVTAAVRERFLDCKILVDANDGHACDDFLRYLSAVADSDLFFIEEPFPENRDDLMKLREHMRKVNCNAVIAEGEGRKGNQDPPAKYGGYTQEHIDNLYALAAEKLVDVFLLDLGILGFTRWRKVMQELVKAGVKASPHTWMWIPRRYYTAHLAAGVGNVLIVEGIPGRANGVDYSAYTFVNGNLKMPDAPGFGLRLT